MINHKQPEVDRFYKRIFAAASAGLLLSAASALSAPAAGPQGKPVVEGLRAEIVSATP